MPLVGSSKSTALEPPMSEQPTESLRFIPPESAAERACALSCRPMAVSIWPTAVLCSDGGTPLSVA
eukprot:4615964-Pleurochrysis_carterae.AAC.3